MPRTDPPLFDRRRAHGVKRLRGRASR